MNAEKTLELAIKIVNEGLSRFFLQLKSEILQTSIKAIDLGRIVEDYTLRGGKRLRATLALVGYWSKEWGAGDLNAISNIMVAIELLQSYLLIHDDIMDRDELRRGGPTTHVMFTKLCLENNWSDCEHYGISQAIVAGDLLEASTIGLLAHRSIDSTVLRDLIYTYSKGLRLVAYGQYLDVMFSKLPLREVREEDVRLVYELKTSSYTVELPLVLGAISSGKYNDKLLRELSMYAYPAGIAFQIRDDIIGLYGDPSVTGKPAGSDVKSKKKTILVTKAYELASVEDKRFLEKVYSELHEDEISEEHVIRVRDIVKDTGALHYAEELISNYVSKTIKSLEESNEICMDAKEFLKWLVYKLSYREK
ncbi:MAG: polyprenyl synthetase family protein [Desulfurococcaceae archaeon]